MNVNQFYQEICSDSTGVYCIVTCNSKTKQWEIHWFDHSPVLGQLMARTAEEKAKQGRDVYFCPTSFSTRNRKAKFRQERLFLPLDIDLKGNTDCKTLADLQKKLVLSFTSLNIKGSFLISSGNGLHVYLQTRSTWTKVPVGELLKDIHATGLKVDAACSIDPVRILRCPNTSNFKDQSDPKPVQLLAANPQLALSAVQENQYLKAATSGPKNQASPGPKTYVAEDDLMKGCLQMQWQRDNPQLVSEPAWLDMVILSVFVQPEGFANRMSALDPARYDDKAREKIKSWEANAGSPPLCSTLDAKNPGVCNGCSLRKYIRTPASIAAAHIAVANPKAAITEAVVPDQYTVTGEGVFLNSEGQLAKVSSIPFWVENVVVHQEGFQTNLIARNQYGTFRKAMKSSYLSTPKGWVECWEGISSNAPFKLARVYIEGTVNHLLSTGQNVFVSEEILGWSPDNQGFKTLHNLHLPGTNPSPVLAKNMAKYRGRAKLSSNNLGMANDVLRKLIAHEQWLLLLKYLITMTAPLFKLVSKDNNIILHTKGKTGAGKSLGRALCESIFFRENCNLLPSNSTGSARIKTLQNVQDFAPQVDEVQGEDALGSAKGLFALASGTTRDALNRDGNQREGAGQEFRVLLFTNSNKSLVELREYTEISSDVNEAVLARIMEFETERSIPDTVAQDLLRAAENVESLLGEDLAAYYVNNLDGVVRTLKSDFMRKARGLSTALAARTLIKPSAFRYREPVYALIFFGMELMKQRLDMEEEAFLPIRNALVQELGKEARNFKENCADDLDKLERILDMILTLYKTRIADARDKPINRLAYDSQGRDGTIVGRLEYEDPQAKKNLVLRIHAPDITFACRRALGLQHDAQAKVALSHLVKEGMLRNTQGTTPRNLGQDCDFEKSKANQRYYTIMLDELAQALGQRAEDFFSSASEECASTPSQPQSEEKHSQPDPEQSQPVSLH